MGPAVFFSLLVIAVAFLPVITLIDQEGRLFRPLAWSKNLTMFLAAVLAVTLDPAMRMLFAHIDPYTFRPRWLSRLATTLLVGTYTAGGGAPDLAPPGRRLRAGLASPCGTRRRSWRRRSRSAPRRCRSTRSSGASSCRRWARGRSSICRRASRGCRSARRRACWRAEKINGDAYLSKWDPRTSRTNAEYEPVTYYNYAVKIPAGATNGELWINDPVFCATDSNGEYGTGDRWFASGGTTNATSAFYTLYDMNNTPYDPNDDPLVASSGSLFANIRASDESLGGPDLGAAGASTDCSVGATANQGDGRYWHDRWWLLASGLQGGKTYRLHTRSTDPANPSAMDNANGHNSFSLWSKATGGTPQAAS